MKLLIHENTSENVVCEMVAILLGLSTLRKVIMLHSHFLSFLNTEMAKYIICPTLTGEVCGVCFDCNLSCYSGITLHALGWQSDMLWHELRIWCGKQDNRYVLNSTPRKCGNTRPAQCSIFRLSCVLIFYSYPVRNKSLTNVPNMIVFAATTMLIMS